MAGGERWSPEHRRAAVLRRLSHASAVAREAFRVAASVGKATCGWCGRSVPLDALMPDPDHETDIMCRDTAACIPPRDDE